MKKIFSILVLLTILNSVFAEGNYPIKTILKGDSVVILKLEQSEKINLQIDTLKQRIDFLKKELDKKEVLLKVETILLESKICEYDNLKQELDSLKNKFVPLDSFKNDILDLAWLGTILYREKDGSFRSINLNNYIWTIWKSNKIVFKPIEDESEWRKSKLEGVQQRDVISNLKLWPPRIESDFPHLYYGNKLRIQIK